MDIESERKTEQFGVELWYTIERREHEDFIKILHFKKDH